MRKAVLQVAILALLSSLASGQVKPEPRVYSAFIKGGPIVSGVITRITPSAQSPETGTVTVDIASELRGHLQKKQIDIPYSTRVNPKYPPFVWARVAPVAGHHVVLFLVEEQGLLYADELLDLDAGEQKFLPKLETLLAIEKQGASGDTKPLIDQLSSSEQDVRSLAAQLLLVRRCGPAAACRMEALDKLISLAEDRNRSKVERVWAASQIAHNVYTGFPAATAIDQAAVNALAALLADNQVAVRDEAVQDLHGLLMGGGTAKPHVEMAAAERTRVVEQLRKDAQAGVEFSSQARDLSELLAKP